MSNVVVLSAYRLEQRRASDEPERLPLAMTATIGAVSLVVANSIELFASPAQAREVSRELARFADEAERLAKEARS